MRPRWCARDAPPMAASNESTEGALPFLEYTGLGEHGLLDGWDEHVYGDSVSTHTHVMTKHGVPKNFTVNF